VDKGNSCEKIGKLRGDKRRATDRDDLAGDVGEI
jgi:hypothetical protein